MDSKDEIITIEDLSHQFGGVVAVDNCTWSLRRGVIAGLIGPNGAGKSTLVSVIAGGIPLQRGRVRFDGVDVRGWSSHRLAQRGLVRTFQVARGFDTLTVLENMLVAAKAQPGEALFNALFRPRLGRAAERVQVAHALDLLEEFDLLPVRNEYASDLSGGQKRLLELARALMSEPKLLMLDEPMSAISPVLVERIGRHLKAMQTRGVTLLLIEHNLGVVEEICDWVTVMVQGRPLASGSMAELRKHAGVVSAYLGE